MNNSVKQHTRTQIVFLYSLILFFVRFVSFEKFVSCFTSVIFEWTHSISKRTGYECYKYCVFAVLIVMYFVFEKEATKKYVCHVFVFV